MADLRRDLRRDLRAALRRRERTPAPNRGPGSPSRCRRWEAGRTGRRNRSPRGRHWPRGWSRRSCAAPPPPLRADACALPRETRKIHLPPQRPIEPRRAHLQLVRVRMRSATSSAAETSRLTRSQSSTPTSAWSSVWSLLGTSRPIDEKAQHPPRAHAHMNLDRDRTQRRARKARRASTSLGCPFSWTFWKQTCVGQKKGRAGPTLLRRQRNFRGAFYNTVICSPQGSRARAKPQDFRAFLLIRAAALGGRLVARWPG